MSDAAPIIVKKIKKGGHGHHGGAWKVAFADFTTAMMAFFLLLWLLAAGTEEQKGSISKYFQNPSDLVGTSSNPSKASVVLGGQAGSMSIVSLTDTNIPNIAGATEGYGSEEGEDDSDDGEDGSDADDKQAENEALVSELRELIEKSPELKDHAEQMLIDIAGLTDERGLKIAIRGMKLIIPKELQFIAERVMNSNLRVGTADNDANAIRNMGMLPEGAVVNHFLTDTDAFFIKTDAPNGFKMFNRSPIKTAMEGDFDTGNMRFKARERYSFGVSDWRCVFGTPGA